MANRTTLIRPDSNPPIPATVTLLPIPEALAAEVEFRRLSADADRTLFVQRFADEMRRCEQAEAKLRVQNRKAKRHGLAVKAEVESHLSNSLAGMADLAGKFGDSIESDHPISAKKAALEANAYQQAELDQAGRLARELYSAAGGQLARSFRRRVVGKAARRPISIVLVFTQTRIA